MAGLAAEGPCGNIDLTAVAAVLGERPRYSRSRSVGDHASCQFASTNDRVSLFLDRHPNGATVTNYQRSPERVDAPGIEAYREYGRLLLVGAGRVLSLEAEEETPGLVELATAAAKAYGMEQGSGDPPEPDVGTDPCDLLKPEELGRVSYFGGGGQWQPVVSRGVWIYGSEVPVASCGYDTSDEVVRADSRPHVEVQLSTEPFDPVAADDEFEPDDREPVDGLGDRAYYAFDSDDTWLVIERSGTQLTIHSEVSHIDRGNVGDDRIQADFEQLARTALGRLPATIEIAESAAAAPCSEAEPAIADALGDRPRYARSATTDWVASCTYTTAAGVTTQVDVRYDLDRKDLAPARKDGTPVGDGTPEIRESHGLVTVLGETSMLTLSLYEPGRRAFPSEYGADHLAVANAAAALLDR